MTIGVDSETAIKTRYVAAVLYYAFQGDAWASKYNFLSDRGTCSWNQRFVDGNHGVACSSDDTVESFQLPANNLVGSIPREIGYYTNLIDLDLSDNLIGGSIASLVNLTHLGTLNCSLNSLTGTLPEFLFTHRSLTDIDFDQNHFFGSISDSLGNSDQLRVFWAQNNSLTGTIPSAVGQSWVLGSIDVNSNQLTGTIPDFTPSSRIWDLHLANNMVTGMIPTTIGSLSSLRNLGLYGNWLTGTIPTELGKCRNIIYVDFDDNSLTGDVGPLIDSFSPSLEGLDASRNLLEGTIPISVGTLTKLSFLDLLENQVGGTLPSELGLLNQLEVLNIAYNEFTGSVPSTLANLSNLATLLLVGNNLNGSSLDSLCSTHIDFFAANTCSEPDMIECACCNHCCDPGETYCDPLV
jgi:Leucine-rich repeat (LRR) protein